MVLDDNVEHFSGPLRMAVEGILFRCEEGSEVYYDLRNLRETGDLGELYRTIKSLRDRGVIRDSRVFDLFNHFRRGYDAKE